MKGEEARVAVEELVARQQQLDSRGGVAPDERALMNQIARLEGGLREREGVRGGSPGGAVGVNEMRVLRLENEDLKVY